MQKYETSKIHMSVYWKNRKIEVLINGQKYTDSRNNIHLYICMHMIHIQKIYIYIIATEIWQKYHIKIPIGNGSLPYTVLEKLNIDM